MPLNDVNPLCGYRGLPEHASACSDSSGVAGSRVVHIDYSCLWSL